MKKFILLTLFFCLFALASFANLPAPLSSSDDIPQKAIPHRPEDFLQTLEENPQAGEKVYLEYCAVCHDPNPSITIGAPRTGIPEDWKHRKQSSDQLLKTVTEGVNNMPARGGCFECSDQLLEAAILYMISQN